MTAPYLKDSQRDVEFRYGFSFKFWLYQCGTKDSVSKAYYMDSGGVEYTDWGFSIYYTGGFLNVVVSTNRYEWRQLFTVWLPTVDTLRHELVSGSGF